jgi:hypothetical protein
MVLTALVGLVSLLFIVIRPINVRINFTESNKKGFALNFVRKKNFGMLYSRVVAKDETTGAT